MRLSKLVRWSAACAAVITGGFLLVAGPGGQSVANATPEARRLPMRFVWNDCKPDCQGWVAAVGVVTEDTPAAFNAFARDRDLNGANLVLESSGGSVNDSMTLGRRFRQLGMLTSVGATREAVGDERASIQDAAYCESMCVFLLLSGTTRYVPDSARIRVHQIWMGDRAEDARGASYTAQDLMIVERDIGRLAKFTSDMGGTGDLLALALSVPPWEELHQMTTEEMRAAKLVTTDIRPDALPTFQTPPAIASYAPKPMQDRFGSEDAKHAEAAEPSSKPTKTAAATGGSAPALPNR